MAYSSPRLFNRQDSRRVIWSIFGGRIPDFEAKWLKRIVSMDSKTELEQLRDEVFRKIGRNVVNFQRIEGMLKFLLTVARTEGPLSQLPEITEQRRKLIDRDTLGKLVRAFHDSACTDPDSDPAAPANLSEIWVRTHISLDDSVFLINEESTLRRLADERNELIHHLVLRWDFGSPANLREASTYLDGQRARVIPAFEQLRGLVNGVRAAITEYKRFIDSEEGARHIDLIIVQSSTVVRCLVDFLEHGSRDDGWAPFTSAAWAVQRDPHALKQRDKLKTDLGLKTLKEIAVAARMFEFREEPTTKGTTLLYRLTQEAGG